MKSIPTERSLITTYEFHKSSPDLSASPANSRALRPVSCALAFARPSCGISGREQHPQREENPMQSVREVMTSDPASVTSDTSAADAAALMRDQDAGAILVVDDGKLRGLVTDRDIVVRAVAGG